MLILQPSTRSRSLLLKSVAGTLTVDADGVLIVQKGANNLNRDETYHPQTREEFDLPPEEKGIDYHETVGQTPLCTLRGRSSGRPWDLNLYFTRNRKGIPKYPPR
ncbi:uncharacterized protein B0H18DRAFT_1125813 [Fomitopsis serialis]|uniref:uncharacterized protein n=1 Tax=Fomitopsis serialis TaxID=139415 RepID=UPI00200738CC|nr:uncharacterized protein B0H18DRAFT_1125813 [Neoantrodia serialis]KAH9914148.1 hypothetical protein B0H18DRAFT_1125813 [Neoantrodia serialis]